MKKIINLYKQVGMTPLQAVQKFKEENSAYRNEKISYAGRLDPMAEGVLLLLIGDENKKIEKYLKLDKEYKAQILFGFLTDSHDILGIPKSLNQQIDIKKLKKQIRQLKGIYFQKYPVYSSKRVRGKPLFYYARKGNLKNIEIPEKTVKIKNIKINSVYTITSGRLLKEIEKKIKKLEGDFRQNDIIKKWQKLLEDKEKKYLITDITISCSSGTYIRAIANDLEGVLLNLIRTRVGRFDIRDALKS